MTSSVYISFTLGGTSDAQTVAASARAYAVFLSVLHCHAGF